MLKIVKNYSNLIPNVSKIKEILEEEGVMPISINSKFSNNTVSSKKEYRDQSKRITKLKIRSDEEYQKMYEENNRRGLTPEDMKFIDQTANEDPTVPS